jgi:hypothetical protein
MHDSALELLSGGSASVSPPRQGRHRRSQEGAIGGGGPASMGCHHCHTASKAPPGECWRSGQAVTEGDVTVSPSVLAPYEFKVSATRRVAAQKISGNLIA